MLTMKRSLSFLFILVLDRYRLYRIELQKVSHYSAKILSIPNSQYWLLQHLLNPSIYFFDNFSKLTNYNETYIITDHISSM